MRGWVPLAACLPVRACEEGTGRQAASGTRIAVSGKHFQNSEAKDLAFGGDARCFASLSMTMPGKNGKLKFPALPGGGDVEDFAVFRDRSAGQIDPLLIGEVEANKIFLVALDTLFGQESPLLHL